MARATGARPAGPLPHPPHREGRPRLRWPDGGGSANIKQRLSALKGVFGEKMPYRAPHTAAPALGALRQLGGQFQVSSVPFEGSTPMRKALEAVEVSLHRQERGYSPAACFGRMPAGFRISTGSSSALASAGKMSRGGKTEDIEDCHAPGLSPSGPLAGNPQGANWCGHRWSAWGRVKDVVSGIGMAEGLYRLRVEDQGGLVYVGQGSVKSRLHAHVAKAGQAELRQASFFACPGLECSVVLSSIWLASQRLELENDLIAAHVLEAGEAPRAQFLG